VVNRAGSRPRPDKPVGDLELRVAPHPFFRRAADDVVCTVPVAFTRAALGAKIELPTLDGKGKLRVPGATASEGAISAWRVNVEVPTSLTERQRELLELLAKELGDEVQPQRKGFMDKLRDLCGEANDRRDNLVYRGRRELGELADRRAAVDVEQQERGTQLQVDRGTELRAHRNRDVEGEPRQRRMAERRLERVGHDIVVRHRAGPRRGKRGPVIPGAGRRRRGLALAVDAHARGGDVTVVRRAAQVFSERFACLGEPIDLY